MTVLVGIIDYGAGNIGSIVNMLSRIGVETAVVSVPEEIEHVDRVILPGVGHFDHGIRELKSRGFYDRLKHHDANAQPILGICLGMQLLMSGSDEGRLPGLDLVPGTCRKFVSDSKLKVPHMGWSSVRPVGASPAINAQLPDSRYYFVHSYFVKPDNPEHEAGVSHYIHDFCSVVDSGGGVLGYQFHPEKSHRYGMALLSAFAGPLC